MPIMVKGSAAADQFGGPIQAVVNPGGIVVGDLLFGLFGTTAGGGVLSMPAGWTSLGQVDHTAGSPHTIYGLKIADAADVITSPFIFAAAAPMVSVAGIVVIAGQDPATPVDVDGRAEGGGPSGPPLPMPCPDVSTTKPNTLIMRVSFLATTTGINGGLVPPPGHALIIDHPPGLMFGMHFSVFCETALQVAPGPTGIEIITFVAPTGASPHDFVSATIAIPAQILGGGSTMFMGDPSNFAIGRESIQRAEGYKIPIPKGTRLKNPVRKIIDPWGELKD